ncbi:MAG: CPBP family intramembrane glutamic endopeptidase [Halanaerobiaceae bacterium]
MPVNLTEKQERLIELIIIIGLAVIPSFFNALFVHLGYIKMDYTSMNQQAALFLQILQQTFMLFVLFYILYRQGRGLKYLGLNFSWKDVISGILLLLTAYGFLVIYFFILSLFIPLEDLNNVPKNVEVFSEGSFGIILVLALIMNSFFEELIVRAYFIKEVEYLTKSSVIAVILCVLIQTSYHIYQGIFPLISIAIIFSVFSIYYVRKKNITPVIIAHTLFNIVSVVGSRLDLSELVK